jgi:hypothetical protein
MKGFIIVIILSNNLKEINPLKQGKKYNQSIYIPAKNRPKANRAPLNSLNRKEIIANSLKI